MHKNSMKAMTLFRDRFLSDMKGVSVLDIGARYAGGNKRTYREIFELDFDYTGFDIKPGKNVDIIGYENIKKTYDIVISGQVMEHVQRPWEWLKNLVKYFKTYICIIAPHTHKEHKHPLDTYRYFPDGMRDLFEYSKIKEVSVFIFGNDTVGIGRRREK